MSAERREHPAATTFEQGRQNLVIVYARSNPASPEPGSPRPNLFVQFEKPDGTDSFSNTVFMKGRPIKTMSSFVIKLYTAAGLKPYVWKNPTDPDEGYEAVMQLLNKTVDAHVGIFLARDGYMRPEVTELYDPPLPDDPIPDLAPAPEDEQAQAEPKPEPESSATWGDVFGHDEPKIEPEPKLDLKSLAYHMHIMHNYLAEYFLEIYRLVVDHKDKSDIDLLAVESKINNQFKKVRSDLGLTP